MKQQPGTIRSAKHRRGFSLIECMLAGVVILGVIVAMMTFRYTAVAHAEQAENQLLAARSANLLSEAWRGQRADTDFDPLLHGFHADFQIEPADVIAFPGSAPAGSRLADLQSQAGLSLLGSYRMIIDGKEFYAQLLYGSLAGVDHLRAIHVLVVWQDHRGVCHEYYLPTLSRS